MADDLGIGDISPTSTTCKIKTPHLQKMADQGLTFLDAHTPSSVCTPSVRAGLPRRSPSCWAFGQRAIASSTVRFPWLSSSGSLKPRK
ncbi:sulfatase-like hydrolase/transferase [Akkermansiaceae bacterium]|nr:sulfatase-like hydrolase/transferase [Akkermansiaceae bacterium]